MKDELNSKIATTIRKHNKLIPLLWFAFISLIIIFTGLLYLNNEFRLHRLHAIDELISIADLKDSQIENWRKERYTDALQLYRTPVLQELAYSYLNNPNNESTRDILFQVMQMYRSTIDYRAIALVDTQGQIVASLPASLKSVCSQADAHLKQVLESRKIVVGDLHYLDDFDDDHTQIKYSYWIPVFSNQGATQTIKGVWVIQLDPSKFLYPLIKSWPVASKTAETLLVRREGEEVVFLNDLRHVPDAALKLRFKISESPDLPAVRAILGEEKVMESRDYRGERVFSVLRNISNSPWMMVTKIDRNEVFQPLRARAWITALFMLVLIVTLALGLSYLDRKKDNEWLRNQLLLEHEKSMLQAEYQEIAQQWQITFDSIRDLVFVLDADNKIVRSNKAAVLASATATEEVIGLKCYDVMHSPDTHPQDCPFERMRESLTREEMEMRFGERTYLITVDPIFGDNGELKGAVHVVRDITASKMAEAEIAKMNRLYALISQINQMVVRTRDQEALLREACEIAVEFGKFKMAWIGKVDYAQKILKPVVWAGEEANYFVGTAPASLEDTPSGQGPSGIAIRTKTAVYCNDIEHDPMMEIWREEALKRGYRSSIVLPVIVNDMVVYTFCLFATETDFFNESELRLLDEVTGDIAFALEMIEAEMMIRVNEARTRQVINIAPVGALGYELSPAGDLILIDANTSASEILKIDVQALVGLPILEAFPGLDPTLPDIYCAVAKGSDAYQNENTVYNTDGIEGIFDIRAMNTGENRMVVFFRDVTEIRKADAAIRKLNEELEHRVEQRTAQLELLNKELEAFSYSVSHDLRSPLRGIDGWAQALFEDYGETMDEQAKGYLDRIRSEAQRMNLLIEALLKLSHVSKKSTTMEPQNLSEIATEVVHRLREQDPQRDVEAIIQPDVSAVADRYLIEIVLTNLLSNAWKFTSKKEKAVLEFGTMNQNNTLVYFVRDNGAGFNMAHAQKLFGAFQRMHKPKDFPGTGIGLTTAQRIIIRHGGEIWAESEPEIGTTFYWTIRSDKNV